MMPLNIECPGCGSAWVLDDAEAGGEFICPTCMGSIKVSEIGSTEPAAALTAPTGISVQAGDEVVCPRCNLHFYPRGRRDDSPVERRRTVLVVEDQEYFRQIATDALDDAYDVRTVGSSNEAREALRNGGIDLLVLDLTLDGGDEGRTLLKELRPKPCPILIFTAQDESELYGENWEELTRLGADDLVMKGMQVGESLKKKARVLLGLPEEDDINA
jgi:CheY-like chemotaxis protein